MQASWSCRSVGTYYLRGSTAIPSSPNISRLVQGKKSNTFICVQTYADIAGTYLHEQGSLRSRRTRIHHLRASRHNKAEAEGKRLDFNGPCDCVVCENISGIFITAGERGNLTARQRTIRPPFASSCRCTNKHQGPGSSLATHPTPSLCGPLLCAQPWAASTHVTDRAGTM